MQLLLRNGKASGNLTSAITVPLRRGANLKDTFGSCNEVNLSFSQPWNVTIDLLDHQAIHAPIDTYISILKDCIDQKCLAKGKQVHAQLLKSELKPDTHTYVGKILIHLYTKCGRMEDAIKMFYSMACHDLSAWNVMIAGYANLGQAEKAFELFHEMCIEGMSPDEITVLSILKACTSLRALEKAKWFHARIIELEFVSNLFIASTLVDMYAKLGCIDEARGVFDKMSERNVVSWSVMISGYVQCGFVDEAFKLFQQMVCDRVKPNEVTFIAILKACSCIEDLEKIKQIHKQTVEVGHLINVNVGNTLVDTYAKCGSTEDAVRVFEKMPLRNVISWTAMISAYAQHGHVEDAFNLFWRMQEENVKPNEVTFTTIIKLCAGQPDLDRGKQVHACIRKNRIKATSFVENCLIDMYIKCGAVENAHLVFNKMLVRDVISWSSILGAYVHQHEHPENAFKLFWQMGCEGVKPNDVTFISLLRVCSNMAAIEKGQQIHDYIIKSGFEIYLCVGNTIVDMYCKCGSLEDARQVFNTMCVRDLASWNALLGGLSQHGHTNEAFDVFYQMAQEGWKVDHLTFLSLLSLCRYVGLVDQGCLYFLKMTEDHSITPTAEHCACMVDLLGRAGCLLEAVEFIKKLPFHSGMVWMALLTTCRNFGCVQVAELAIEGILKSASENTAALVLLSNVYAAAGRWEDKAKVRQYMEERGMKKEAGHSRIEINNKVHVFAADDTSNPHFREIHAELERLYRQIDEAGHVPNTTSILHNLAEEQKEFTIFYHSEMLAIAFGLIKTAAGTPLCVIKNLCVCGDCHAAIKFISKIVKRDIVVMDSSRVHHFKNGACSCGDYW